MSLLQRVSDMERIVESERGDVQTLAQECRTLRTEAVSAREECEKAQRLKGQLEALVVQLQEDAGEVCLMYVCCQCHMLHAASELVTTVSLVFLMQCIQHGCH